MTSNRFQSPAGRLPRFFILAIFLFGALNLTAQDYSSAKQYGGTNASATRSMGQVLFDAAGNSYSNVICTGTVDVDPGPGTLNFTSTTVLVKQDASGNLLWAKEINGILALDAAGFLYVTGNFTGTKDFDPGAGVSNLSSFGYDDVFVAKYDSDGNFIWAKQVGGGFRELAGGITVTSTGGLYVTGNFGYGGQISPINSCDFDPDPVTSYSLTNLGESDGFILSLDLDGQFIAVLQKGTAAHDNVGSIGTDSGGDLYYLTSSNSNHSLERATGSLSILWSRDIADIMFGPISVDAAGNIYLAGGLSGTVDFDPGPGVASFSATTVQDPAFMKYNSTGTFQWARSIKANGFATGIIADANGNVYTTGSFNAKGNIDFDPGPSAYNLKVSARATFVQKLDAGGNFVWAVKMGGDAKTTSAGRAIGISPSNNVLTAFEISGRVDVNPGTATNYLTARGNQDLVIQAMSQAANRPAALWVDASVVVNDIVISPNPSKGDVVLTMPRFASAVSIMIYDAAGKLVLSRKLPAGAANRLPINNIGRAGLYSVIVNGDGKTYNSRVVVN